MAAPMFLRDNHKITLYFLFMVYIIHFLSLIDAYEAYITAKSSECLELSCVRC